ncbi:TRAP transporter fused permease subunit [Pseudonocardia sp. NPDC049635]|uniref:TRAP transporter permease n=1 Tax=Pseudonocardia sp. NPDC049635 TaxID=3155506 RepID=UPI0033D67A3B
MVQAGARHTGEDDHGDAGDARGARDEVPTAELDDERPGRVLRGPVSLLVGLVCAAVSVFAIVQVLDPLTRGIQFYLMIFLAATLPLVFLTYRAGLPARLRGHRRLGAWLDGESPGALDRTLAVVALLVATYPMLPFPVLGGGGGFDAFLDRQGLLLPVDVIAGGLLTLLVLEACRRTTGWILPAICLVFLGYGYYGGLLPQGWEIAHRGLDFSQIVNALYNDASGFYGTPLAVAASYIVLFTLYGVVLEFSGAGRFFVDLSLGLTGRSSGGPGRAVTMSGFLLGTVSGSGAATTVTLGSVAWPVLRRAGYPREVGGGLLAAAGIGAILSPPTLGAAAFIIAEYLAVPYLQVLVWAVIPSVLYYLGIVLAVEIGARRLRTRAVDAGVPPAGRTLLRYGYHLVSPAVMVGALVMHVSAPRAVLLATLTAFLLSFLDRSRAMSPSGIYRALAGGARAVLPVVAVCAAAGIITATVTRTGLGLQTASLLVRGAEQLGAGNPVAVLLLTVLFAALAVSLLGLAVPVTASFIISWVVIGPALIELGVGAPQAAMFIFYFAVLSEVTPPTALAAVAAAAITGGNAIGTMWQTLRVTLPAFLVPIAIVATPAGQGVLLQGDLLTILGAFAACACAVAALAGVTGGWIVGPATGPERLLLTPAALLPLYLHPLTAAIGAGFAVLAVGVHLVRRTRTPKEPTV